MLADIVDHVIGIDPGRDQITALLVEASTGGELATAAFETTRGGYERLVAWADRHTSRESRAWAVEAYIAKRPTEGKTLRGAQRCLKRYIARQIYRLLQHPKINT